MCACKLKHLYMKVNRKLRIEYGPGVAYIITIFFPLMGRGERSVSVFVLCLFSFERIARLQGTSENNHYIFACLPPTGYVITDRK